MTNRGGTSLILEMAQKEIRKLILKHVRYDKLEIQFCFEFVFGKLDLKLLNLETRWYDKVEFKVGLLAHGGK